MPPPTHGPRCRTLFCRPSRCKDCRGEVFYWACTCGSHVLFDKLGDPWPVHRCRGKVASKAGARKSGRDYSGEATRVNVTPTSTYTYGVLSVVCPRCGKSVRKKDVDAHNYWTHGVGKKPELGKRSGSRWQSSGRTSRATRSSSSGTAPSGPLIACPRCGARVLEKNMQKHLSKKCPKRKRG